MKLNRRQFGFGLMAGATLAATGVPAARAANADTIRFGYLYPNLTTLAFGVATHIDAYKKAGLKVEGKRFTSGQTVEGIQSVFRGELDIYYGGGPESLFLDSRLIDAGKPSAMAVISAGNAGATNFVVSNKIKAKTFDELVGKPLRIGISSPSSDHLALFNGWLSTAKDMKSNQLGWQFIKVSGSNMPQALLTDQIDGFLHSEPTTALAIMSKAGHVFMAASRGDFGANPPPMTFMATNRDFLGKNGDLVRAFLKASQSANDFYKSASKEEMISIISQWSGTKKGVLAVAYDRINPVLGMSHDQAQKWWDFVGTPMVKGGKISEKLDPFRDVFDLDYQAEA